MLLLLASFLCLQEPARPVPNAHSARPPRLLQSKRAGTRAVGADLPDKYGGYGLANLTKPHKTSQNLTKPHKTSQNLTFSACLPNRKTPQRGRGVNLPCGHLVPTAR